MGVRLFHQRYKWLIVGSIYSGWYHPHIRHIYSSAFIRNMLLLYTFIMDIMLVYIPISALIHIIFITDSMDLIILDIMILSSSIQSSTRLLYLIYKRKELYEIYDTLDRTFVSDEEEIYRKREKYYLAYHNKLFRMILIWSVMAFLMLNGYISTDYFVADKVITRVPIVFPYRNQSPDHELTLLTYTIPCLSQPWLTGSLEMFTLIPLWWEAAELDRLAESLPKIFGQLSDSGSIQKIDQSSVIEKVAADFTVWIKEHQRLCRYHEKVQKILSVSFSVSLTCTFMSAWLIPFRLSGENVRFSDKVACVGFYFPYLAFFKITCSCVDTIKDKSSNLFIEALSKNWSALPETHKKNFKIVQLRMLKPFTVKSFIIFPVITATYMQLIRMAYTVANFLRVATAN